MHGQLKKLANRILEIPEKPLLNGFEEIAKYATNPGPRERLLFCLKNFFLTRLLTQRRTTINFIITSKAETRVFEPILSKIRENPDCRANIVFLSPFRFSSAFHKKVEGCPNIEVFYSIYPIVNSCRQNKNWVNVICLDHERQSRYHRTGIEVIGAVNNQGGKTVCLQHGSVRKDNIEGHKTSVSRFQIVWGGHIYRSLIEDPTIRDSNIFITGNPLHDELFILNRESIALKFETYLTSIGCSLKNRKIILLATCLHSEYDDREDPLECYRNYIRKIVDSIDYERYFLVIKMHPVDSVNPNLYQEVLNFVNKNNIAIISADEAKMNIYELATIASLVITRASTVAEESLMIGKNVLAFDLFRDGPSSELEFLKYMPIFEICTGSDKDLKAMISETAERDPPDNKTQREFVFNIGYKLDGKSSERVLDVLQLISRSKSQSKAFL